MAKKSSSKKTVTASKKQGKIAFIYRWLDKASVKYKFEKRLPFLSVGLLLVSSVYWSIQSLLIQKNNADQLINPYFFDSSEVARSAIYPSAHTFLFKWPIFALVRLFHYSQPAYIGLSLLTVIVTISALVFLIYKIEKRPLYFSTICFALSSVLLMIPANPYAGGLLPVNMAMLATRNLEYVAFIATLLALVKSKKLFDRYFLATVFISVLLFASDRLFLFISVAGSLVALVLFALVKYWRLVSLASTWLISSLLAGIMAMVVLAVINWTGLVIINGTSASGPYGLTSNAKDLVLGIFYAFSNTLTNMGANPAFDATRIKDYFDVLGGRIFSVGGLTYIINLAVFGAGLGALWLVALKPLIKIKSSNMTVSQWVKLLYLLIASTFAALTIFIFTNHYYAVDSRYLTIILFTIFIAIAIALSKQTLKPHKLLLADIVLVIAILLGAIFSHQLFKEQNGAYQDVENRNQTISKVIASKPVTTLLGDYWRVVPIKNQSKKTIKVSPLADCTTPRSSLTSGAWYPDLNKHSFAYLLSLDKSLSDFPKCSLDQIIKTYGKPNSSIVISGSLDHPKELLLYYDHGAHKNTQHSYRQQASTIFPINPDELTGTVCSVPTSMNVVAHPDDDLLFINPDVEKDIKSGNCVRTVVLTAGDAGHANYYWLSRQRGSQAAYSYMIDNKQDIWIEKTVKLGDRKFITVAAPKNNAKVSLIYLHLPDGNLNGEGFSSTASESLSKLLGSSEQSITSVDGQSQYDKKGLTDALSQIMQIYQPTELHTQSTERGSVYPDHSDHNATGVIASEAFRQFETQRFGGNVSLPIIFYAGYPIHALPANLSSEQAKNKAGTFLAYAKYDGSVCKNFDRCLAHSNYGLYVERQYKK